MSGGGGSVRLGRQLGKVDMKNTPSISDNKQSADPSHPATRHQYNLALPSSHPCKRDSAQDLHIGQKKHLCNNYALRAPCTSCIYGTGYHLVFTEFTQEAGQATALLGSFPHVFTPLHFAVNPLPNY